MFSIQKLQARFNISIACNILNVILLSSFGKVVLFLISEISISLKILLPCKETIQIVSTAEKFQNVNVILDLYIIFYILIISLIVHKV